MNSAYYPNIRAVAGSLVPRNPLAQQQWTAYALSCVKPGLDYFREKFGNDTKPPLSQFKVMRYFSPKQVFELQLFAVDIDSLLVVPFLNDPAVITSLKEELPAYLARSTDVNPPDIAQWWKSNELHLPKMVCSSKEGSFGSTKFCCS